MIRFAILGSVIKPISAMVIKKYADLYINVIPLNAMNTTIIILDTIETIAILITSSKPT